MREILKRLRDFILCCKKTVDVIEEVVEEVEKKINIQELYMANKKTQTQSRNQTYIVVDFLDLDTKKFSLSNPKPNKYGGGYAALRYDGKTLYVRYDGRFSPFGISTNKNKHGEVTGSHFSTTISLTENDPYLLKAREIDDFFIDKCVENSVLWGLGGSSSQKVNYNTIAGYDDKGQGGKWKRILKYSYKIEHGERIYQDYPPRMEFNVPKSICKFFDGDGKPCCASELTNWSKINVLAMWGSVAFGTWGASIKPKAQQIKVVLKNENFDSDECLLDF